MSDNREKTMYAHADGGPGSEVAASGALVREMREARRAALNLMEDAILAQRRAEELNLRLLTEIEQRKRTEADLRKREREYRETQERLALLLESFKDFAIFTTDPDGKIVSWN